jgi:hypothetical protein
VARWLPRARARAPAFSPLSRLVHPGAHTGAAWGRGRATAAASAVPLTPPLRTRQNMPSRHSCTPSWHWRPRRFEGQRQNHSLRDSSSAHCGRGVDVEQGCHRAAEAGGSDVRLQYRQAAKCGAAASRGGAAGRRARRGRSARATGRPLALTSPPLRHVSVELPHAVCASLQLGPPQFPARAGVGAGAYERWGLQVRGHAALRWRRARPSRRHSLRAAAAEQLVAAPGPHSRGQLQTSCCGLLGSGAHLPPLPGA